jgi:hypothetical protein
VMCCCRICTAKLQPEEKRPPKHTHPTSFKTAYTACPKCSHRFGIPAENLQGNFAEPILGPTFKRDGVTEKRPEVAAPNEIVEQK